MSRYTLEEIAAQYRGANIAILGNGPTVIYRNDQGGVMGKADFSQYPHPLWSINGGWHYHPNSSLGFMMDDVRGPSIHEHPDPPWYVALVEHATIPILTSKAYPDFPALVEFPLADVMRFFELAYFAESINYMIAFAVMTGVERIEFYGADYMNARPQERASTEFWASVSHGLWLARKHWRAAKKKASTKEARALERMFALMPEGREHVGAQIVVSPASEMMKARYDELYYMPGFYGYNKDSFPIRYEEKGGPANVNVILDAPYSSKWWRPVTKEAA